MEKEEEREEDDKKCEKRKGRIAGKESEKEGRRK